MIIFYLKKYNFYYQNVLDDKVSWYCNNSNTLKIYMKFQKTNLNLKRKIFMSSTIHIISVSNLEEQNEGLPGPAKKVQKETKKNILEIIQ